MTKLEIQNERVGKIVAAKPGLAKLFEKYQIDYCCQGSVTLDEACQAGGVDLDQVLTEIDEMMSTPEDLESTDWNKLTLSELVEHIVQTHHAFLRSELPRITELIAKVNNAHGERHSELAEIQEIFRAMRSELEMHMMKEENILFPAITAMELAIPAGGFPFGSVANPIGMMEHEHDEVGRALRSLRKLTDSYTPPKDACPTYRVMMDSLSQLERDLHLHIHKENNILFPAAQVLEQTASTA